MKKRKTFTPHDDAFLKQWALDFYKEKIFTSDMLTKRGEERLMEQVFMPLIFMDDDLRKEIREAAANKTFGLVYEYYDKSGPRGVNGFPMFTSCGFLCKEDCDKINVMLGKIRTQMQEFEGEK